GRLRHGPAVGGHQGRPRRDPRGGSHRRRHRGADLLPRRGPADRLDDRGGAHDHRHPGAERLRHRVRADRWELQHRRGREPLLHRAVQLPATGSRGGHRGRADHRDDPGDDLQRPHLPGGRSAMTTTPTPPVASGGPTQEAGRGALERGARGTPKPKGRREGGKTLVRIAVLLICLAWTIPTLGLLISSFRDRDAILNSGWWTVFANPLDFTQWTLENYGEVLEAGMGAAFVNSLAVTIPATVIPILAAAFAAYAFAWMRFPGRDFL